MPSSYHAPEAAPPQSSGAPDEAERGDGLARTPRRVGLAFFWPDPAGTGVLTCNRGEDACGPWTWKRHIAAITQ